MTGRILHLAKSLSFTDKSMKMGMRSVNGLLEKWRLRTKCSKKRLVSVNHQHNGQKFTDKPLENAGLSVNLNEIFDKSVEQHCI